MSRATFTADKIMATAFTLDRYPEISPEMQIERDRLRNSMRDKFVTILSDFAEAETADLRRQVEDEQAELEARREILDAIQKEANATSWLGSMDKIRELTRRMKQIEDNVLAYYCKALPGCCYHSPDQAVARMATEIEGLRRELADRNEQLRVLILKFSQLSAPSPPAEREAQRINEALNDYTMTEQDAEDLERILSQPVPDSVKNAKPLPERKAEREERLRQIPEKLQPYMQSDVLIRDTMSFYVCGMVDLETALVNGLVTAANLVGYYQQKLLSCLQESTKSALAGGDEGATLNTKGNE